MAYLTTKSKFKSCKFTNITVVMGNESCDLDSTVSSIVYAAFLNWKNFRDNTNQTDLYIPLLDVDSKDFPLKTEVVHCLKANGVSDDNIFFRLSKICLSLFSLLSFWLASGNHVLDQDMTGISRDNIDFEDFMKTFEIKIILVDHHILAKRYEFLCDNVVEIIDHRPKDRKGWCYKKTVLTTMPIVGSCSTLIAEKITDADFFSSNPVTAKLLYSAILLDTMNFSKEANKATPLDEAVVLYLEDILHVKDRDKERQILLDDLLRARSDVSSLTTSQLLRKDLKVVGDVLVPSFPILVKDFLQKPKALESVTEALGLNNCSVALLLGMDVTEGLKRDGLILSREETKAEELANMLQKWSSPILELVFEPDVNRFYFRQNNLSASRKQYMPVLCDFLNKI